jgi:hypothetical protein
LQLAHISACRSAILKSVLSATEPEMRWMIAN